MIDDVLESAADELAEARAKIAATRELLERALEGGEVPELRQAVARLERMEAKIEVLPVQPVVRA